MKTVVSLQELIEVELRPAGLLAEYMALTKADLSERWGAESAPRVAVPCQACGTTTPSDAFDKFGFQYQQCGACASLYVSPRPTAGELDLYYRESPAIRFWRERVLPATADARAQKIALPRAQWVADGLAEHCADAELALDLSPAGSTLGQELLGVRPGASANRSYDLASLGVGGASRVVVHQDEHPGAVDVVTAFDVLDRTFDVRALVQSIRARLKPGGVLFATATSISGFDLQVLWERSTTLTPPDKLQALSIAGFRTLFAEPDWELIELSTPGMLDSENVRRAVRTDPNASWPRLIRTLAANLDERGWTSLQEFLQEHRLASFTRLIARRRE